MKSVMVAAVEEKTAVTKVHTLLLIATELWTLLFEPGVPYVPPPLT
jgi:hypothetical protein